MKESIREHILETLKKEKITPKPRWHFLLKDGFLWFGGIGAMIVGSIAMSVVFFLGANQEGFIAKVLFLSGWREFLSYALILWLVLLILFLGIAWYNIRHTKRGYRFHVAFISMIFILPFLGGAFLYEVGAGHFTEALVNTYIPSYETVMERRQSLWNHPEQGLLGGKIISFRGENEILLRDMIGKDWTILYLKDFDTKEDAFLEEGVLVRIEGKLIEKDIFEAYRILPWELRGMHPQTMRDQREHFGYPKREVRGEVKGRGTFCKERFSLEECEM